MSDVFSTVFPVVALILDGGMIMFGYFLYLLENIYKNISKTTSVGATTLVIKGNTKT